MTAALGRARAHLLALQENRGCWEGEMVWCPVILAQRAIVLTDKTTSATARSAAMAPASQKAAGRRDR